MNSNKHTRNQNACDMCRSRRVKCRSVEGEEICEGCRFLGVACTSNRPRRRRGPPNRHLTHASPSAGHEESFIPPISPISFQPSIASTETSIVSASPTSSPSTNALDVVGPRRLIHKIIDDWFTHIHPLAPILHSRRFLSRLHSGDANSDSTFCGLVISVICATCATLRRKSFTEYKPITFKRCVSTIRSQDLLSADGPYTADWCIAKYNIATSSMAIKGLSDPWTHRMLSEAVTGTRYLLNYKADDLDLLEGEMLKRLYCLLEISAINVVMVGEPSFGHLTCERSDFPTTPHPYTDADLDVSHFPSQGVDMNTQPIPSDRGTYVPGLTYLRSIFLTWHTCQTDRFYLPASQLLTSGLRAIQTTIDTLPPELRWRGGLSRPENATRGHDVQIANIFITSLYVRSNLLQQFGTLSDTGNMEEHQRIVSDLLEVLCHLPQETLEANGYSLIPKIRDIGAAYLEVLKVDIDGGLVDVGDEAKEKLERLLRQLGVLILGAC
ncbi:Zn(II)2Cys6 transcription factor [Aspergillus stella-maris]|uniref:Zn(II)2Cys6 transcription factor n=1 Tax=Aspergillus stella-maris TaxID=1810926 RepID=UPI003CCE090C